MTPQSDASHGPLRARSRRARRRRRSTPVHAEVLVAPAPATAAPAAEPADPFVPSEPILPEVPDVAEVAEAGPGPATEPPYAEADPDGWEVPEPATEPTTEPPYAEADPDGWDLPEPATEPTTVAPYAEADPDGWEVPEPAPAADPPPAVSFPATEPLGPSGPFPAAGPLPTFAPEPELDPRPEPADDPPTREPDPVPIYQVPVTHRYGRSGGPFPTPAPAPAPARPHDDDPAPLAVATATLTEEPPTADARTPAPAARSHRSHRRSTTRNTVEWIVIIGFALISALVIKTWLLQAFYIPSPSMVPTLHVNDRVLVNKLSYRLHDVHRGDVVVFERPPNDSGEIKDLIKRVVGLAGETVEAHDGRIWIDGRQLREPYLPAGTETSPFGPQVVPEGHLWVMGDNRTNSSDSRVFGAIDEKTVVGRAFVRVWPVPKIGLL